MRGFQGENGKRNRQARAREIRCLGVKIYVTTDTLRQSDIGTEYRKITALDMWMGVSTTVDPT